MPGTGPETGDRTATQNLYSLPMKLTKESQYQCDIQLSLNLTLTQGSGEPCHYHALFVDRVNGKSTLQ